MRDGQLVLVFQRVYETIQRKRVTKARNGRIEVSRARQAVSAHRSDGQRQATTSAIFRSQPWQFAATGRTQQLLAGMCRAKQTVLRQQSGADTGLKKRQVMLNAVRK